MGKFGRDPEFLKEVEVNVGSHIFDKAAVQKLMTQKLSGNAGASEFWRMFALLRWLELFKVNLI